MKSLVSVVVPVYNEAAGLEEFHSLLVTSLNELSSYAFEIIYCDDGSNDDTPRLLNTFSAHDKRVKVIRLSRNFGKENALLAGIAQAVGEAIITLDADGQHPPKLISSFLKEWSDGAQVVIGRRTNTSGGDPLKRLGSWSYAQIAGQSRTNLTDFRLLDQEVQTALLTLPETDRITRNLIDWLGFKRVLIPFSAPPRKKGKPTYTSGKLIRLALNSFVSSSPAPLYFFGMLGIVSTLCALLLGGAVFIEQLVLNDPLGWNFTGTAMLAILLVFLVGLVLVSQGIVSLYVSHTHRQTLKRPLFVIDYTHSQGIKKPDTRS